MSAENKCLADIVKRGYVGNDPSKAPARATFSNGGHTSASGSGDIDWTEVRKRQRHSTGGTAGNSTVSHQFQPLPATAMPMSNFKTMSVDEKLDVIFSSMQAMQIINNKVGDLERNVLINTRDMSKTIDRVTVLEYKSIDLEARSRRNNLLFHGIPEVVNEDSVSIIKEFLSTKLKLPSIIDIHIQRAHRLGRMQYNRGGRGFRPRHRPIIVALRDDQDVDEILSNANRLTGTPFGINRDYPPEIVQARKDLYPMMKRYRAEKPGSKVTIQFPARLVIDRTVIVDKFPDWHEVLRRSRHVTRSSRPFIQDRSIDDAGSIASEGSARSADLMEAETETIADELPPVPQQPIPQLAASAAPAATGSFSMDRLLTDSQVSRHDTGNHTHGTMPPELPVDLTNTSDSGKVT